MVCKIDFHRITPTPIISLRQPIQEPVNHLRASCLIFTSRVIYTYSTPNLRVLGVLSLLGGAVPFPTSIPTSLAHCCAPRFRRAVCSRFSHIKMKIALNHRHFDIELPKEFYRARHHRRQAGLMHQAIDQPKRITPWVLYYPFKCNHRAPISRKNRFYA